MNKKRNNKGFSLVELIVVIAVMAVLVVVLAPAYLRYVDKAKLQKDVSAVSEVVQAIKISASEEAVAEVISKGVVVTISDTDAGATITTDVTTETTTIKDNSNALLTELNATIGSIDFTSKDLNTTSVTITVSQDGNYNLTLVVDGNHANVDKLSENVPTT